MGGALAIVEDYQSSDGPYDGVSAQNRTASRGMGTFRRILDYQSTIRPKTVDPVLVDDYQSNPRIRDTLRTP